MSGWKKRWKNELDRIIPDLRDDVKNAPIETGRKRAEESSPLREKLRKAMDWLRSRQGGVAVGAVCAACVIAVCVTTPWTRTFHNVTAEAKVVEAISVDCDAAAVFAVDEDGLVTSVTAENAEADVILASYGREDKIEGVSAETATSIFVDYAARLGFLDLSACNATLLSYTKADGKQEDVRAALETYFCEKGAYAAVATERVTAAELARRLGVSDVEQEQDLWENLRTMPSLYSARNGLGKEGDSLTAAYRDCVSVESLKKVTERALNSRLSDIEENLQALENIGRLSKAIKTHKDNPYRYFADYWALVALDKAYSAELLALMTEMRTALDAYENRYGQEIRSVSEFLSASNAVSRENAYGELLNALEEFTTELFETRFTEWIQMLKNVGFDVTLLEYWYEEPSDYGTYREKTLQYENMRFYYLWSTNQSVYEAQRKPLTRGEYTTFVQGILDEYGSLKAYWEKISK